ncbi:ABC transporter permease subunit [Ectothiorhodospiraceae bacterium 2226]|nr:ABC transporter permease subunit [Ectothiorhodospiraceae bacterium 2226]
MMVFTLAGRELRALFLSPLAWTLLGLVQLILAFVFLAQVEEFLAVQGQLPLMEGAPGATELIVAPLLGSSVLVLLLTVPLLTMRLVSEERRNQTLPLLLSAPVSMTEIVLGKYLGVVTFLLIMLVMIALMPLSLLFGGTLDFGLFAAGLLGLALLLGAFAAVGLFLSTLTAHPAVAAVGTFAVLLLLWIIDWAGARVTPGDDAPLLAYVSMLRHYEALLRGVFDSSDVIYYLLFILTFLVLSVRRLDADRLRG